MGRCEHLTLLRSELRAKTLISGVSWFVFLTTLVSYPTCAMKYDLKL
jgi:hypothetical protein